MAMNLSSWIWVRVETHFIHAIMIYNGVSSLSAFTAEQYQQHQEQLALMQKQQLEQIQLQQQANSTATANSTHVSIPQSFRLSDTD